MDFGRFKGYAEQAAMDATGRKLAIDGAVHLSLLPSPSLVAEKVRFANAPWGSAPDMAKVDKVEARVALVPLLARKVVVERLVLVSPEILLETDKYRQGNWEFDRAAAGRAGAHLAARQAAAPGEGATAAIPVLERYHHRKGAVGVQGRQDRQDDAHWHSKSST